MSALYGLQPTFGHSIFDHADFGDRRRNARMAESFDTLRRHPGGSLPDKFSSPADLRAFYRLCDCDQVNHGSVIEAVRQNTLLKIASCRSRILILHDATELDYTTLKSLSGDLAPIGKGTRRGYICQNVLAVNADTGAVIGLLDQILHRRARPPKKETVAQLRARSTRESLLWLQGTEHLDADTRLVDVCDRGADTFEFLEHECNSGRRFVIRSTKVRKVHPGHQADEQKQNLAEYAASLPELGCYTMNVQPQKGRRGGDKARAARSARQDARFIVQGGALLVCRPHAKRGNHGNDPLPLYVVRVTEAEPPTGQKPVQWTLLTNEPVETFEDAWKIISWYEKRWIVEELHKGMKTGCRIEDVQFTTVDRLQPAIALLTAVAVTLLELRDLSRCAQAETMEAEEVLDPVYVIVLSLWRFGKARRLTVHEFFFALARLGGHQNRKSDRHPGWIVIWRGWAKLRNFVLGYEAANTKCGKT